MHALVYHGPGQPSWELHPRPSIQAPTDVVVRITTSTICGSDLHILKGDVSTVAEGRILGHEGIGVIDEAGAGVSAFHKGDRVLISCITACAKCDFCRKRMFSHCRNGGWILGNTIDGTQAEYVRIPHADNSLHKVPPASNEEALVMLSDILPTGHEIGVLNGGVKPGDTIAIVGAGPVGMSALLTSLFYSPAKIYMIDLDDNRLKVAKSFGATDTINSGNEDAVKKIMAETKDGVDVAIEAVGMPATFDVCQSIVRPGGRIANVGVHGKPVNLQIQDLWIRNITLTTGLVNTNTTPMLLKTVAAGKLDPNKLVTHHFKLDDILHAYEVFGSAAKEKVMKVMIAA